MAKLIKEIPCDICDTVVNVNSFCLNCKQNFCDNCKKGHVRTALTKHHKFLPVGDSHFSSDTLCSKHQLEKTFYCRTCSITTCSECLPELHKTHDFDLITKHVAEARKETEDGLSEKQKHIANVKSILQDYNSVTVKCKRDLETNASHIKTTIKGWIEDLKSLEKEMLDTNKKAAENELKRIANFKKTLESEENIMNDIKAKLRKSSDVSVLDEKSDILSEIAALNIPSPAEIFPQVPKVTLRQSTRDDVRKIVTSTDSQATLDAKSVGERHTKSRVVELPRTRQGFGFSVNGGDQVVSPIHVSMVMQNSVADHVGLKEGDQLLSIDGVSVEGERHFRAVELVKQAKDTLQLVVRYNPQWPE